MGLTRPYHIQEHSVQRPQRRILRRANILNSLEVRRVNSKTLRDLRNFSKICSLGQRQSVRVRMDP